MTRLKKGEDIGPASGWTVGLGFSISLFINLRNEVS